MSNPFHPGWVPATALALVLAGLILGACGESSTSSSAGSAVTPPTGSSTSSTATAPSKKAVAAAEALLSRYRACLRKYGVTLPASKIGEPIKHPNGVTESQYAAARLKCRGLLGGTASTPEGKGPTGGTPPGQSPTPSLPTGQAGTANTPKAHAPRGPAHPSRPAQVTSARLAQLRNFVACMRENGVNLPRPTKRMPLFAPKGVDVGSPQYAAAEMKCLPRLTSKR
jgi:hypothetical protein